MKNYELMKLLSSLPAGAEVKMNIIVTKEELNDPIDNDIHGCEVYSYSAAAQDVDCDGDRTIYIYT